MSIGSTARSTTFDDWCNAWKAAKHNVGDIGAVINLRRVPRGQEKMSWEKVLGYRKSNTTDRGEQKIERQLLGARGFIEVHELYANHRYYPLVSLYQNMSLTKKHRVIADAFGVVLVHGTSHPLVIEVKVSAQNCWSALVQNIQQVLLLRANPKPAQQFMPGMSRGAWGMVLARKDYYDRDPAHLAACTALLKELKKAKTEIRVVLAVADKLKHHKIWVMAGNWDWS